MSILTYVQRLQNRQRCRLVAARKRTGVERKERRLPRQAKGGNGHVHSERRYALMLEAPQRLPGGRTREHTHLAAAAASSRLHSG